LAIKGFVKINSFKIKNNQTYILVPLTPNELKEKAKTTNRFLCEKVKEFEDIKRQIREI